MNQNSPSFEAIKVKFAHNQLEVEECQEIRKEVFVKEQGVHPEEEYDGYDEEARHLIAYCESTPVGTARYRKTEEGIKLERYAVLPQYRRKGVASVLLEKTLTNLSFSDEKVYLHAQMPVKDFYENAGFKQESEKFEEAGIEHVKMSLQKEHS